MRGGGEATYLDLYDYRSRVLALYAERNRSLVQNVPPEEVLHRFRRGRDALFHDHPQSALDGHQKAYFPGLQYFPYNPDAAVVATLEPREGARVRVVEIGDEERIPLREAAAVTFVLAGVAATLSVFWIDVYGGGLFLPFKDASAPRETYGGGRYLVDTVKGSDFLELSEMDGERRIVLDFNYAYNPSCAYNPRWTCPLAPPENCLTFAIAAGEKIYSGDGLPA